MCYEQYLHIEMRRKLCVPALGRFILRAICTSLGIHPIAHIFPGLHNELASVSYTLAMKRI